MRIKVIDELLVKQRRQCGELCVEEDNCASARKLSANEAGALRIEERMVAPVARSSASSVCSAA